MNSGTVGSERVCGGCACINHQIASYNYDPPLPSLDAPELEHLSETNDAPCPAEVQSLRGFLGDVKGDLNEINYAISSLSLKKHYFLSQVEKIKDELQSLYRRSSVLQRIQRETKSLLSPLRSLPSELLLAIFDYALEPNALPKPHAFYSLTDLGMIKAREREVQLVTLLLVCRRWRAEVEAAPRLWSKILIDLSALPGAITLGAAEAPDRDLNPKWMPYFLQTVQHVAHTQSAPISITLFDDKPSFVPRYPSTPPQALTLLLPFANRIRELQLRVPHQCIRQLSPLGQSLGALESVAISGRAAFQGEGAAGQNVLDTTMLFASAPRLRQLSLFDFTRVPQFAINRKNITSFNANHIDCGLSVVQYLSLLRQMVALEACHVKCDKMYEPGTQQNIGVAPLVHTKLKRLVITCGNYAATLKSASGLLNILELPALEHLDVDCCAYDTDICAAICKMVSRSKCPLISLRMSYGYLAVGLVGLLQEVPTLEELCLENICDTVVNRRSGEGLSKQLVMALKADGKNAAVPMLKTMRCSGVMTVSGWAWADMILSRWSSKGCAMLSDISLRWPMDNTHGTGNSLLVGPPAVDLVALLTAKLHKKKPVGVKLALRVDPSRRY